jgi:hypothetical protein
LSADANPQFAVDPGTIATSVTRLERLIRDADAFIGIYPFPEDTDVTVERLKSESRYFRLELDLAERASKPAMVFVDSRFGNVIAPPPQIIQVRFKSDEIAPNVQSPRARNFRGRVDDFCRWVTASLAHQSRRAARRNEAIFVSYSGKDADLAAEVITALKQRFQDDFDYRDAGKSIPGGASWIEEIFKRIAARRAALFAVLFRKRQLRA